MKAFVLISVVCMQLGCSFGFPGPNPNPVGAFAYQDSAGNRYGGTYGLQDGQVFGDTKELGNLPFSPFAEEENFFPQFFRNLQNLLQEAFKDQLENQDTALNAARKAYDLTSNAALNTDFDRFADVTSFRGGSPFMPGFGNPFETPGFGAPFFGNNMRRGMSPFVPSFGPNSAFAGAAAGPGITRQAIALNPRNPNKPNIDVMRFGEPLRAGAPQFFGVSSSSYSSSSNVNGKEVVQQGGETLVNDNGKVTSYRLQN